MLSTLTSAMHILNEDPKFGMHGGIYNGSRKTGGSAESEKRELGFELARRGSVEALGWW